MARFRHSASFGKRQEFAAIAELLRRGYDVYMTLVDDQGIDCVVRQGPREYFDVQIKARSLESKAGKRGLFTLIDCSEPRPNYVFIFYAEGVGENGRYWVISSMDIVRKGFATTLKSGPNIGKYRVVLNRPKYAAYVDAFEQAFGAPPTLDEAR